MFAFLVFATLLGTLWNIVLWKKKNHSGPECFDEAGCYDTCLQVMSRIDGFRKKSKII